MKLKSNTNCVHNNFHVFIHINTHVLTHVHVTHITAQITCPPTLQGTTLNVTCQTPGLTPTGYTCQFDEMQAEPCMYFRGDLYLLSKHAVNRVYQIIAAK